jgi:hypothetical protein
MKRRKHLFKIEQNRRKNKARNIIGAKSKNVTVYSYKCGQKNIKLTVEKEEVLKPPPEDSSGVYYYACSFCSKDFDAQIQTCPDCHQPLVRVNLKKCPQCSAKNTPLRQSCWVCNAPFPQLQTPPSEKDTRLLLTLNVDGNIYRNTDRYLGLGLRKLFEDLIAAGFSREPLEAWAKLYEGQVESKKELIREECKTLVRESKQRALGYTLVLAGIIVFIAIMVIRGMFS